MTLPGWFSNNLWLKGLSLTIALVIWVFVRVEQMGEVLLRVPVRYVGVPESLVVVGDTVPEVEMVVEGPRTLLAQLDREGQSYTVDLSDAKPGIVQSRIRAESINLPRGVSIVRIMPAVIETELRPTQSKRLPVQARLTGNVAPGYEISNVEIEPDSVEVVAAAGDLDGVAAVRTVPINIEGQKSDWSGVVELAIDEWNIKSITTREVDVFYQVVPKMVENRIDDVPVIVRGPNGGYRVVPASVRIRVMGPENLVSKLSRESLTAVVDVRQVLSGASELPVTVRLPDQVVLLAVEPQRVRVVPQP